jgi:hypothetical protein
MDWTNVLVQRELEKSGFVLSSIFGFYPAAGADGVAIWPW